MRSLTTDLSLPQAERGSTYDRLSTGHPAAGNTQLGKSLLYLPKQDPNVDHDDPLLSFIHKCKQRKQNRQAQQRLFLVLRFFLLKTKGEKFNA